MEDPKLRSIKKLTFSKESIKVLSAPSTGVTPPPTASDLSQDNRCRLCC